MKREEFGWPGHFIASKRCRFHRHTHVGAYCVSTVGDYCPRGLSEEKPTEIGCDRLFETMVFELGADGDPVSWMELDSRAYNDRESANRGHDEMVGRWAEKPAPLQRQRTDSEGSNG